ncbi:polysaccharide biosynthesis protein [Candidatus Pelagibacter sp. RS40]|uniref:polysaccharide biosynthesis protein n=1 Tax=Candidatus Pelagibacter sp. RS40 TaxID=1977865 RepID=UPI000A151391|nr:nucleoside-diphosphate sugar epimerase/dehydratase [Candidatus Pelagibacter sp. RS40]ARJ49258.1 polysaccharide biosynthesis protein [Candidatus Pelagibacter sp. RS40]
MLKKLYNLFGSISDLPRYVKQFAAVICDFSLTIISFWLSFYLRLDEFIKLKENTLTSALALAVLAVLVFWISGFYKTIFRYSGKSALSSISLAIGIYGLLTIILITIYGISGVPRSIGIIHPLVLFFLVYVSRLFVRYFLDGNFFLKNNKSSQSRVIIYGAGAAGRQLISVLEDAREMKVLGFIDDNLQLQNKLINGMMVYSVKNLDYLIKSKDVSHVLLAIPSANRSKRIEILDKIKKYKVAVITLPSFSDIIKGKISTSDIKELDIEDLLGRDQVLPNQDLLNKNVKNKTIMVTGAGGSIGSELSRQIIKLDPKELILIDISEHSLYKIYSELEQIKLKIEKQLIITPIIASIQDEVRIENIIKTFRPNTLYHAAAHKHVPLVEENICEGLNNNIFGTLKIAKIAFSYEISDFVLISSDKAVRPTNVMGVSKRISELCLLAFAGENKHKTKVSLVRFGNVLGSSGSVIPKFKDQIKKGGPVTLTHPEVTRYFMTASEAAQLVIQAGALSQGGDLFILEMGKPIKIKDLIKKIISLSGLSIKDKDNPDGDISIEITGLRPGEKLYEELLLGQNPKSTIHPKIQKVEDPYMNWRELKPHLLSLEKLIEASDVKEILKILKKIVNEYEINNNIVDHVYKFKNNK